MCNKKNLGCKTFTEFPNLPRAVFNIRGCSIGIVSTDLRKALKDVTLTTKYIFVTNSMIITAKVQIRFRVDFYRQIPPQSPVHRPCNRGSRRSRDHRRPRRTSDCFRTCAPRGTSRIRSRRRTRCTLNRIHRCQKWCTHVYTVVSRYLKLCTHRFIKVYTVYLKTTLYTLEMYS